MRIAGASRVDGRAGSMTHSVRRRLDLQCAMCGRQEVAGAFYCQDCGQRLLHRSDVAAEPLDQQSHWDVPWGVGQILLGIVIVLILLFVAAAAAAGVAAIYSSQEDAVATWVSVHLTASAVLATVWFLGLRHCRSPFTTLGLNSFRLPAKRTFLLSAAVLGASLVCTSVYSVVVNWLDVGVLEPPELDADIAFDGTAVLLTFQALALMTPIAEEVFFRGFIFSGLLRRFGPWWAIIASALVFSAFHLAWGVVIPIFVTGLLLAWLYWRTGSLWAAIAAHAGQNALAVGVGIWGG